MLLCVATLLALAAAPAEVVPAPGWIVHSPIDWDEDREQLTLDYRRQHYGETAPTSTIDPTIVVVHHTAIDELAPSLKSFKPARLRSRQQLQKASMLNVSAHFLIDRDGTVHQLMPTTRIGRHVIGLNWTAIGIENVGGNKKKLTQAQRRANTRLIRYLKQRHPKLLWLIGHHEYQRFKGTPLWKERDEGYLTGKIDPGDAFMAQLRADLKDLGLQGPPPTKGR